MSADKKKLYENSKLLYNLKYNVKRYDNAVLEESDEYKKIDYTYLVDYFEGYTWRIRCETDLTNNINTYDVWNLSFKDSTIADSIKQFDENIAEINSIIAKTIIKDRINIIRKKNP